MSDKKPKIYRMNDCDTVIAYSKKEAIDWYFNESGTCEEREYIAEECERLLDLSKTFWWNCWGPEELWDRAIKLKYREELIISVWSGDPAYLVSFQYLIENMLNKISIPSLICSTEF